MSNPSSRGTIRRLMLRDITSEDQAFDLVPFSWSQTSGTRPEQREKSLSVQPHSGITLARLSHLSIATKMSDSAIKILASVLPHLNVVHFSIGRYSRALLQHFRVQSLKSLATSPMHEDAI
ncbi:hypothetical protein BGZ47_011249 [Haplosporangium gracile]|nr:hypothetical protein BGZ47_011249 [Haplosporangium gracile]